MLCVVDQEFDVSRVTVRELEFVGDFQLTINQDSLCHVRPYSTYTTPHTVIVGACCAGNCGVL